MRTPSMLFAIALACAALAPCVQAQKPLPCTSTDVSSLHFYNAFGSANDARPGAFGASAALAGAYSTNGVPTGCDVLGSDGDNEQGTLGGQFPLAGAGCPYAQDEANGAPVTTGHHGDGYVVTNLAGLDIVWFAGIDGAASQLAPCLGNGVITDDPVTDPFDCHSTLGASVRLLGLPFERTAHLVPNSAWAGCEAADGNAWVFVMAGPVECAGSVHLSLPVQGMIYDVGGSAGLGDVSC